MISPEANTTKNQKTVVFWFIINYVNIGKSIKQMPNTQKFPLESIFQAHQLYSGRPR